MDGEARNLTAACGWWELLGWGQPQGWCRQLGGTGIAWGYGQSCKARKIILLGCSRAKQGFAAEPLLRGCRALQDIENCTSG